MPPRLRNLPAPQPRRPSDDRRRPNRPRPRRRPGLPRPGTTTRSTPPPSNTARSRLANRRSPDRPAGCARNAASAPSSTGSENAEPAARPPADRPARGAQRSDLTAAQRCPGPVAPLRCATDPGRFPVRWVVTYCARTSTKCDRPGARTVNPHQAATARSPLRSARALQPLSVTRTRCARNRKWLPARLPLRG